MNVLLLMNPSSRGGHGRRLWNRLFDALVQRDISFEKRILTCIEEAFEFAREAKDFDVVVAVGGDGTVNAVGAGVLSNPNPALKFAVLYTGTSPDFCNFHHIPTDPEAAVELLASGISRAIPVLQANGHPFFCSCNPGMGAEVATAANRFRPWFGDGIGTFFALAKALIRNRKRTFHINTEKTIEKCNHLLITRMPYIAGGIRIDVPPLKDDEYVLWHLSGVSRCGWLAILPKLYRSGKLGVAEVVHGRTNIACEENCALEYDGDAHGNLPLTIDFCPRKLNLICGRENEHE